MKIVALLIIAVLILAHPVFGATSEDTSLYVRKDVFEVYMQNIDAKFERILDELRSQRDELHSQRLEITSFRQNINSLANSVSVLSERIDGLDAKLSARIDGLDARLSARIDGLDARLSARIDGIDARVGDLRNDIYLGLVILGIVVSLPTVQKLLQAREKQTSNSPSAITLDDVKRLIEENNVKLHQKFQA